MTPQLTVTREDVTPLVSAAFRLLGTLLKDSHGSLEQTAALIFKNLLPNVLMNYRTNSTSIPKSLVATRNEALRFVQLVSYLSVPDTYRSVAEQKEPAFQPALHAFLQHICVRVVDKAEYRNYACGTIEKILSGFASTEVPRFIKFLLKTANNPKVVVLELFQQFQAPTRLFAIEVACTLLKSNSSILDESSLENIPPEYQAYSGATPLLNLLLGRSADKVIAVSLSVNQLRLLPFVPKPSVA